MSRYHDVIANVARSTSRSNREIAIARSVLSYSVDTEYCHNLWLMTISVSVWEIDRVRKSKPFSGIFIIHVLYTIVLIGLQIWQLHCELCKTRPVWPRWRHQWRQAWLWILSSIFIFRKGWVPGQVLWPVSQEWLRISYFRFIHDRRRSQDITHFKIADQRSRSPGY